MHGGHIEHARDPVVGERGFVTWPASNSIFSVMVKPSCMIAPPESCVSTIRGLTGVPTSATLTSFVTVTRPVSVSTSTSTPAPPTIQNGVTSGDRPVS